MSFDAHNLIVPSVDGVLPGGSKSPEASDASVAETKSRFDRILAAQTDMVAPALPEATPGVPVEAVTEIAPIVIPQGFAAPLFDEALAEAAKETAQTLPALTASAEATSSGAPSSEGVILPQASTVSPDPILAQPVTPELAQSEPSSAKAAEAVKATETAPLKLAETAQAATSDISSDLDLAAALMAAQLAASEEATGDKAVGEEVADADLEALLKTLPPELAALLQATAKPAPKPLLSDAVTNAPVHADIAPDEGLTLSEDKVATKSATDPSLSAVKDMPVAADAADEAALPAAATASPASATPAQTAQGDTQALLNSLSNRLNGATAASSASTAATAQAYVMSNQTADNIASLAAQIHKRMDGKTLRFDMELRPSDMGRVDVRMEINADGKLSAHLSFDSPVAETEFRGRQDDLRRQLEQSGFNLEDGSLSFSSRDQNPQQQSARDDNDQAGVTASAASAQFSRHQDLTDDLALNSWVPGMDGFDSGRLSLNVRV